MSHDRARLSALVDGELDHDARDRVLAHLAQCDECRAVVETERRVKALLSGMPEASPGGDFLARLNSLGDPGAEPAIEPPAPAKRRMVGRGRNAATKRAPATESGRPGADPLNPTAGERRRLGTLRLRFPVAGLRANGRMADQAAADAPGTGELRHGEPRSGELGIGEQGTDELRAGELRSAERGTGELRAGEFRSGELRAGESRSGELGIGERGTDELRAGESRSGELAAGELRAGELGTDQLLADELAAGVRAPGGFLLGVLRIGGQPADASALHELSTDTTTPADSGADEIRVGDPRADATSAAEPAAAGVAFGEQSMRRMRPTYGAPTRPAGSRPFGYPDVHGSRRPGRLRSARLRSSRLGRRFTVGVAGAASLAGMALVTAFTVGGAGGPTTADVKVVPPIQRYTVQHADTAVNLPYSDPGAATATIGDSNLTGLLSTNR